MRYSYFDITNFKGIRHLRLDLDGRGETAPTDGRIFTLVGLNESGKTTILEAIDFFTGGPSDDEVGPIEITGRLPIDPAEIVPVADRANFNGSARISVGLILEDSDLVALRKSLRVDHQYRMASIPQDLEITDVYDFKNSEFVSRKTMWPSALGAGRSGSQRKDWPLTKSSNGDVWLAIVKFIRDHLPPIWYFPNFLFDFPSRIYLREHESESITNRFYRELMQDVLDSLDIEATVSTHLVDRILSSEPSAKVALESVVLRMARTLSDEVFAAWNRILQREVQMRLVLTTGVDPANDEPFLELRIEDHDGYYFVHDRSLGFRWFFVFLLLTTFRNLRPDASNGLLYLFDEPASNLHSTAQSQLLASLERLASRVSVIYTTHSHHLINPDWLENTFVVRNSGVDPTADMIRATAQGTDVSIERYRTFVGSYPDQTQYFRPILEVLDYAPSKLEMVPSIVMLEGKNDFYLLRMAQLLTTSQPRLYPGGGAGSLDNVIALYLAWGTEFIVVLDSDTEGDTQKDRYLDRFGAVLTDRVFTLGDLVPELQGASLDRVFSEADKVSLQEHFHLDRWPSKKTLMRLVQEAVATKNPVLVSSETATQLQELLAAMKDKLFDVGLAPSGESDD